MLRRLGREERTFFGKRATRARWTMAARTPALQGSGESRRCEAVDASALPVMARPFYSSGCRWRGPAVSSRPSLPLYHCTPDYEYLMSWLRVLDAQARLVRTRRPVAPLQRSSTLLTIVREHTPSDCGSTCCARAPCFRIATATSRPARFRTATASASDDLGPDLVLDREEERN